MRVIESIRNKLSGLIQAINRYPLTVLFLLAIAVGNMLTINQIGNYSQYLITFTIGALLSTVGQMLYERFFTKISERLMLMGGAILLTFVYYFFIRSASIYSTENNIKTTVMIFALSMAFIWVPTIKSKITFNESFMSTFKALFITILFSFVIAGGVSLIIFAMDNLLLAMDRKVISHSLNLVYSLFAPIFFLSYAPLFLGKKDRSLTEQEMALRKENIEKAVSCPKNLEILISYIVIPLTSVYTIILLIYILLNIRGNFWTENLMEPMLVSYAITVILVYILASNLENQFARLYRKIFPKVLVPIVLFQTIASLLKIGEMGVTHGRYYVIMFGVFALIAGLVFSFLPPRKNGLIVLVLVIFSAISITPPVDAFTVSRVNQIQLLEKVLVENHMFENDVIIPNADISIEDKRMITQTVRYLYKMNYMKQIDWLPNDLFFYENFKKTFGFSEVYDLSQGEVIQSKYANLDWRNLAVDIEGHDFMFYLHINGYKSRVDDYLEIPFEKNGTRYLLTIKPKGGYYTIRVDENREELIHFDTKNLFTHIFENDLENSLESGDSLTVEQATLVQENERIKMTILVHSAHIYNSDYSADFNVFLEIK